MTSAGGQSRQGICGRCRHWAADPRDAVPTIGFCRKDWPNTGGGIVIVAYASQQCVDFNPWREPREGARCVGGCSQRAPVIAGVER